jgi:hypothetical protein
MSNNCYSVWEPYFVVPSKIGMAAPMPATNFAGTEMKWHGSGQRFGKAEKFLRNIFSFYFDGSFLFGCTESAARPLGRGFLERLML